MRASLSLKIVFGADAVILFELFLNSLAQGLIAASRGKGVRVVELLVHNAHLLLHLEGSVLERVKVRSELSLNAEKGALREASGA